MPKTSQDSTQTKFSLKEEAFCVAYTTIGSDTYGNATSAAREAGYSEKSARTQGWKLLKKVEIRQRILQLHTENMQRNLITIDKVLSDLEHDKVQARKDHQFAVAKGCTELQGRYLAMFTDRYQDADREIPQLSEEKQARLEMVARYLTKGA